MAKKWHRILFWFICKNCGRQNYVSERNKLNTPKIELRKYCPQCKSHQLHKNKDKLK